MTTPYIHIDFQSGWWIATIKLDSNTLHTQGRNLAELYQMIDDALDIAREDPDLPTPGDARMMTFAPRIHNFTIETTQARHEADRAQQRAQHVQRDAVKEMRREGMKTADIGTLLGITKGRVSQLANS